MSVRTLLARGVDVNAKSPTGETALGHALRRGNTPIVELLRKAGATEVPAPAAPAASRSPAEVATRRHRTKPAAAAADRYGLSETIGLRVVSQQHAHGDERLRGATERHSGQRGRRARESEDDRRVRRWMAREAGSGNRDSRRRRYGQLHPARMAAEHYPADAATDAMAHFLKRQQLPNGQWRPLAHRPPIESSDIQATAASMRALQLYAPAADRATLRQIDPPCGGLAGAGRSRPTCRIGRSSCSA